MKNWFSHCSFFFLRIKCQFDFFTRKSIIDLSREGPCHNMVTNICSTSLLSSNKGHKNSTTIIDSNCPPTTNPSSSSVSLFHWAALQIIPSTFGWLYAECGWGVDPFSLLCCSSDDSIVQFSWLFLLSNSHEGHCTSGQRSPLISPLLSHSILIWKKLCMKESAWVLFATTQQQNKCHFIQTTLPPRLKEPAIIIQLQCVCTLLCVSLVYCFCISYSFFRIQQRNLLPKISLWFLRDLFFLLSVLNLGQSACEDERASVCDWCHLYKTLKILLKLLPIMSVICHMLCFTNCF